MTTDKNGQICVNKTLVLLVVLFVGLLLGYLVLNNKVNINSQAGGNTPVCSIKSNGSLDLSLTKVFKSSTVPNDTDVCPGTCDGTIKKFGVFQNKCYALASKIKSRSSYTNVAGEKVWLATCINQETDISNCNGLTGAGGLRPTLAAPANSGLSTAVRCDAGVNQPTAKLVDVDPSDSAKANLICPGTCAADKKLVGVNGTQCYALAGKVGQFYPTSDKKHWWVTCANKVVENSQCSSALNYTALKPTVAPPTDMPYTVKCDLGLQPQAKIVYMASGKVPVEANVCPGTCPATKQTLSVNTATNTCYQLNGKLNNTSYKLSSVTIGGVAYDKYSVTCTHKVVGNDQCISKGVPNSSRLTTPTAGATAGAAINCPDPLPNNANTCDTYNGCNSARADANGKCIVLDYSGNDCPAGTVLKDVDRTVGTDPKITKNADWAAKFDCKP